MDKHGQIDMLHGPIWNKLPRFALPIAATAILEQLFNASDVAVVGNFTGGLKTIAVAAVGANSPVIGLVLNLFIGIALGVNVVIATAAGRGDAEAVRRTVHTAVHTAVTMSVVCGALIAAAGELAAPALLGMMNVPGEVLPHALTYLRIYLLGMPVILLYNFESAIFRSVGETAVPLLALFHVAGGGSPDLCGRCGGAAARRGKAHGRVQQRAGGHRRRLHEAEDSVRRVCVHCFV